MRMIHLTDEQVQEAERSQRRFHDEALDSSDLGEEIDYWLRHRALLTADLAAGDTRDMGEPVLQAGIDYATLRLDELTRQAERIARAMNVPGYPPARPRADLSARFAAARYVDLVDLVETLTSRPVIKSGSRYRASCPFHEDRTPSLTIYEPGKGWHCFSCNRGGDAVALVSQLKTIPAVEALELVEVLTNSYLESWERRS